MQLLPHDDTLTIDVVVEVDVVVVVTGGIVVVVDVVVTNELAFKGNTFGVGVVDTDIGATVLVVGNTTVGFPVVPMGAGRHGWQPGGPIGGPVVVVVVVPVVPVVVVVVVLLVVPVVPVVVVVVGGDVVVSSMITY